MPGLFGLVNLEWCTDAGEAEGDPIKLICGDRDVAGPRAGRLDTGILTKGLFRSRSIRLDGGAHQVERPRGGQALGQERRSIAARELPLGEGIPSRLCLGDAIHAE